MAGRGVVLPVAAGVDPEALLQRLRALEPLRAKGFVQCSTGVRLVQGVGSRIELSELDFDPAPELLGRLVIVRRADR